MTNCKAFFGLDEGWFKDRACLDTASEIAGQPGLWHGLGRALLERKQDIADFMAKAGGNKNLRIILTGAGSSAFIGETLAGFAASAAGVRAEAIHTTDIVSSPDTVLFPDIPTLLVSFGRSGNSPESVGAVRYARKTVKNLYEAAIVCDGTSKLHDITAESDKSLILVMPEGSNDKGFAMTSSVTCMLLAGFALLCGGRIDELAGDIGRLAENVEKTALQNSKLAQEIAQKPFERAVFLGSGGAKGLMHEGSLKMMELTDGAVFASYDSAAGFRHGPKTVIKDNTLSLHYISNSEFTAKYDKDLLNEMFAEKDGNTILAIAGEDAAGLSADETLRLISGGYGFAAGLCVGISGLVFMQMLAMFKSLELKVTTDNPSPSGKVNRVVKGVTVYPL